MIKTVPLFALKSDAVALGSPSDLPLLQTNIPATTSNQKNCKQQGRRNYNNKERISLGTGCVGLWTMVAKGLYPFDWKLSNALLVNAITSSYSISDKLMLCIVQFALGAAGACLERVKEILEYRIRRRRRMV